MVKDVKCPVCGSHKIELDDVYDIYNEEDKNGEDLVECVTGVCQCCGRDIQWKKIYRYLAVEDVEVV